MLLQKPIKPKTVKPMKIITRYSLAIAVLVAGAGLTILAAPPPGQVDFGEFTPPADGGQFVEVHVDSNLLSMAAQVVEKQQPDVARLLRSVQLIHVNVIGLTDKNRAELKERVQQIRHNLETQGWNHNVAVQEKDQDVGVYTKTRGGESLAGLAVTVIDPKDAVVLVNIVGDIRPDQVAALGDKLNIKPLKDIGAALKESQKEPAKEETAPKN